MALVSPLSEEFVRSRANMVPVPGATVVYPDAPILVQPPAGSDLQPLAEEVLIAAASDEATWQSGSYNSAEFKGSLTDPKESNQTELAGILARSAATVNVTEFDTTYRT